MGPKKPATLRPEEHRQDAASRRSVGLRNGSKYDIVITDNKTAPAIPVGGQMQPIA
jgi:hypothetical protein